MQFRVDQRNLELRARVQEAAAAGSIAQLDLAWQLGAIQAEGMFRGWRTERGAAFKTFGDWIAHDLASHVSQAKAVRLAMVGVWLRGARELIDRLATEGSLGISRLMRLAKLLADHHVTMDEVVAALEQGRVLPEESLGRFPKDTQTRLYFDYPSSLGPDVRRGLTYLALRTGASSLEEALAAVARQAIATHDLPEQVARFRRRIDEGTFRCRLCGKLPLDPIEVVVGQEVLLCRAPCWSPLVESDQAKYAGRWRMLDRTRAAMESE